MSGKFESFFNEGKNAFQLSLREGFRMKVIESLRQAWLLKY